MLTMTLNYNDRMVEMYYERSELDHAWGLAKSIHALARQGVGFEGLMSITLDDGQGSFNLKWTV